MAKSIDGAFAEVEDAWSKVRLLPDEAAGLLWTFERELWTRMLALGALRRCFWRDGHGRCVRRCTNAAAPRTSWSRSGRRSSGRASARPVVYAAGGSSEEPAQGSRGSGRRPGAGPRRRFQPWRDDGGHAALRADGVFAGARDTFRETYEWTPAARHAAHGGCGRRRGARVPGASCTARRRRRDPGRPGRCQRSR